MNRRVWAAIVAVVLALSPSLVLRGLRARRIARIEHQLPDALRSAQQTIAFKQAVIDKITH